MMADKLRRQPTGTGPEGGLLRAEHFQMGYLTTDMAQAKVLFGERLGIAGFANLDGELPGGGQIRAAFAWAGTIMYELIEAKGSVIPVYNDWLPDDGGFHLRHHHLGYLLHDRAQFDAVVAGAERSGGSVAHVSSNPLVDVCFVTAPLLGHYLEYLLPTEMGLAFFDSVPRT